MNRLLNNHGSAERKSGSMEDEAGGRKEVKIKSSGIGSKQSEET